MRRAVAALSVAVALALCAGIAHAQTTDTEREAAAAILRQIDSLETRLKPTETAQRLATRADPARDRLLARVAAGWTRQMPGLFHRIGPHPQSGWHEVQGVGPLPPGLTTY